MTTLTPTQEDTRVYELCVLYAYPINQKDEGDLLKEIEKLFEDAGGIQMTKDLWGRRGLAYTVEGHNEGSFVVYHYELDPSKLEEIDEALYIMPGVLRHLIIKPPKGYQVINYSEQYKAWLKDRESEEERKQKQKEEDIKRRVADKAKRQAKRVEQKKADAPEEEKKPLKTGELNEELEKLISDDDLDL